MNADTYSRLVAHRPELVARLSDFHVSFNINGRVVSRNIEHTTHCAAVAHLDLLVEQAEAEAMLSPRRRDRGLATNLSVRKIERIAPDVRAQMAIARAHGNAHRPI